MTAHTSSLLLGLIGQGIGPSRTPAMHEAEGLAQGIPTVYRRIDTAVIDAEKYDLRQLLDAAIALGFNGLNITHPHKQEVVQYLDGISSEAEQIGAVNTVVIREGKLYGYNTDATGFARGLREGLPGVKKDVVVQVGAGGAGNAVAHALMASGVTKLYVADIDRQRAADLAASVGVDVVGIELSEIPQFIAQADGLVNATPVGMAQHPGTPIDTTLLRPEMWVSDVIYMPLETQLLKDAKALGCQVLGGSRMAVGQAVEAFELFTGRPADATRMETTFINQE